jgi:hypothetical protein
MNLLIRDANNCIVTIKIALEYEKYEKSKNLYLYVNGITTEAINSDYRVTLSFVQEIEV